jgi:hypothetical protein
MDYNFFFSMNLLGYLICLFFNIKANYESTKNKNQYLWKNDPQKSKF